MAPCAVHLNVILLPQPGKDEEVHHSAGPSREFFFSGNDLLPSPRQGITFTSVIVRRTTGGKMIRSLFAQFGFSTKIRFIDYLFFCFLFRLTGFRCKRTWVFPIAGLRYRIHIGLGELKIIYENNLRCIYTQFPEFSPMQGWTVLDVGANIGATSLCYASSMKRGRIIAVEPHPSTLKSLRTNLALNSFEGLVEIEEVAVSDQSGSISMFIPEDGTMAMQTASGLAHHKGKIIEIPCVTIDSLLTRHKIDHLNLLKIDIEGYELDALKGATETLQRTDFVVLEYHSEELRSACQELLEHAGFTIREWETILYANRSSN